MFDDGMTLVEVLMVIAIMGLALVLGATCWRGWKQARRLDDAVERIGVLVKQVRTESQRREQAL
jgi:prepilin-type N-terminal cleavage/methylation domain-containing protein